MSLPYTWLKNSSEVKELLKIWSPRIYDFKKSGEGFFTFPGFPISSCYKEMCLLLFLLRLMLQHHISLMQWQLYRLKKLSVAVEVAGKTVRISTWWTWEFEYSYSIRVPCLTRNLPLWVWQFCRLQSTNFYK